MKICFASFYCNNIDQFDHKKLVWALNEPNGLCI